MTMIRCVSPVDGSVYAERPALNLDDAKAVVARARKAQKAWAKRPLDERIALVLKGVAQLNEMGDEVVTELAWQMGRPVKYGGEFKGFNERSNYMASIAGDALAPLVIEDSAAFKRFIAREPHGVVFVIAPWNYPYMTAINSVAPALIAGNAVILKHASQTLLTGQRLARAFHEAGVPEEVFANVFLDHETSSRLIAEKQFDFINFTGSVTGGQAIERAAAGTFTGIGLELGGKDPGYVMEDADLDKAVDTLMDGATFNSGQCCCGIERIYVHESLYDAFVEKSVAWVSNYRLGNPLDPETSLGPMAHKRFAQVVREQITEATAKGARALVDPKLFPQDDGGAYLAPQVLVDVDHSMTIMREETFGPAVGIMKVRDDAEAVALMNDSKYGLTVSLWTSDAERAARLGQELETGTVFMNRADYLDPALCWTGVKETGRGGSLSVIGFHNLTRPKSYHLKRAG
ncbi:MULTISPECIES: aldehyde dehydrogenase family protein [Bosea]|uniref:aldehyde dehydrogenase family protein n=1 Tax=Bosea TaxID=85413 RepID=UPI00215068B7|nr:MULTISPECIES: aldehyde dehydrogenase family protein [Bosea]MCR4523013.1 aldehyde dehydrogenase family protein [Bosea sp. 47.2.35]MDR6829960.1 acyl-CoA reductase-like NAD-dependent aldehyde dehydrogenase [Bosea robiniae]MDR6896842.1 acyl-CoA reductase-like NAD-dependent aldehyde dehydrogenase [Bosea sp. BE109]MDR7140136.1 acyl-CoA reductase-like NAD-dependent aldehyde dehydrogenase [Bosea sp. BE168]MDR7176833.1 acyl-CoA reductase-like NAD-dependent aldehyde dehydrogenase [Bosea sp. BE271]